MSSPRGPKRVVLLNLAITDELASLPIDVLGYTHLACYLTGTGTVSSGSVTYEENTYDELKDPLPGGAWSIIGTAVAAAGATAGATVATHFPVAAYSHVRARIDTVIAGGGSIKVVLIATD